MKTIKKLSVIALALTFSFCSETESLETTPEYYDLKYEVIGPSPTRKLTYDSNNGSVEETNVVLPFTKEIRYKTEVDGELNIDGTRSYGFKRISIRASNAVPNMQVKLYIDGKLVDFNQDKLSPEVLSASFSYRRRSEK
jgi:hypothetical protein